MPFEDNSFDAAYSIEATCHAPELVEVRVLRHACYARVRSERGGASVVLMHAIAGSEVRHLRVGDYAPVRQVQPVPRGDHRQDLPRQRPSGAAHLPGSHRRSQGGTHGHALSANRPNAGDLTAVDAGATARRVLRWCWSATWHRHLRYRGGHGWPWGNWSTT
eukprot:scaffold1235_cov358-Prasinococcus_capsulatus_cf.AAC.8